MFPVITTKTGDKGVTSLWSGERLSKGNFRFNLLSLLDSFDSTIGIIRSEMKLTFIDSLSEHLGNLRFIQERLIQFKAEIATMENSWYNMNEDKKIQQSDIDWIDNLIENSRLILSQKNYLLTGWILYGDEGKLASLLDKARAECRIFEVALHESESQLMFSDDKLEPKRYEYRKELKVFINRISDYLFLEARRLSI